jgi:hypothetical protein
LQISERKPLCRRESNNVDIEDILAHTPEDPSIAFSTVFELGGPGGEALVKSPGNTVCNTHSRLATIAKYVASTGQVSEMEIGKGLYCSKKTWINWKRVVGTLFIKGEKNLF